MQRDKQRIVLSAMLDCAAPPQSLRVAGGIEQLDQPLYRDQSDDEDDQGHWPSRTRNPAVKPGPSALSSMRRLAP